MPSWPLRNFNCDANASVSPVTRSGQIKHKFGQMQELTSDNYSEISYVAYSVLNIRPLNLVLIKKNQQLHSRSQYWNNNEAAPANG